VALAKEYNTRLHILHISTADELPLFTNAVPLAEKRITAEVCVHHLWFDAGDYERLGNRIKCNPAIKDARHKRPSSKPCSTTGSTSLPPTTPRTRRREIHGYWQSHAGLPLVQHPLLLMLEFYHQGRIALPKVVEKMCHAPATLFNVEQRGYLREGYWADLVLVDLGQPTTVSRENVHYKCGWSPLEGTTFRSPVTHTVVSGHLAYAEGRFDESETGKRLLFNR
jgi:dihydroorotase